MSSTTPPRRPDPSAGPLNTESNLERAFRARFDSLTAQARPYLQGAESATHRVVIAVFFEAWNERAKLNTPEALDAFLKEQIPHAAARELSRQAGTHHYAASEGHHSARGGNPVDVDGAWARLLDRLHPDRVKAENTIKSATRHEAAAKVKDLSKKRNWTVPIIIGIIVIVAGWIGTRYLNHLGRASVIQTALRQGADKATTTPDVQTAAMTLADGSRIKLGPDSKVVVAEGFGEDLRAIQVSGAIAITVAPGHAAPLEVHVYNAVVRAPGGTLFIRTSDHDSSAVLVTQGSTDSLRVGATSRGLHDGPGLYVALDSTIRAATPGEFDEATTWVSDTLTVADRNLSQVLDVMGSWFGTHILVLDSTLLSRTITFQAPLGATTDAISAIEKGAHVKFGYQGTAMVFRDAKK